jgi:Spy/CpxP family protein refolding chaperone
MTTLTRGKLSLILAAMFLVGVVVGSLATVYGVHERQKQPSKSHAEPPAPQDRSGNRKSIEERFTERLKLTDQQREQLKPVFAQLATESGLIRSNSFCQAEAAIEKANATLRPLLTESQRAEFEKMNQERKEFMRPWRDRGGRKDKDKDSEPSHGEKADKNDKPGVPHVE